jgi:hypothetical protein
MNFGGVCAIAGAAMKVVKATRVAKVFMRFSIVRKSDPTLPKLSFGDRR